MQRLFNCYLWQIFSLAMIIANILKRISPQRVVLISANNKQESCVSSILVSKIQYNFTRLQKKTQLILHSSQTIEKIHLSKKQYKKEWNAHSQIDTERFKVSLVGLPNCGKSSLFNCFVGDKLAIVDKIPGMTRDRRQFSIESGLITFIDTPGVQLSLNKKKQGQKLLQDIFMQTIHALHQSSMVLFVIDSKLPITSTQIQFAKYLKTFSSKRNIIVVCNKCQSDIDQQELLNQVSKLGFKEIFMTSSTQGSGVLELMNHINDLIPEQMKQKNKQKRQARKEKFESIIKNMKAQLEALKQAKDIKISMKEWEKDFRKINPNPQQNQDLDQENPQKFFIRPQQAFSSSRGAEIKNLRMKNAIKICFIGRPNVGKSSLINQILGQDKLIVSETPHTTRDSISTKILYKDRKIYLTDTAGLNTPNFDKNKDQYLRKVQISTMLHVHESHLVVYVMDAFSAFQIHDFELIKSVINQGRPVLIAVNKWEAIKEPYRYKAKNYLIKQLDKNLGQLNGHPLVFVSAKMGIGLNELMDKIVVTYDKWNTRVSTGLLNDWLDKFKKVDNLPKEDDHQLRINYLIQARVRPPLFIFFVNNRDLFKSNYMRFITRNFAKEFQMDGIPIRTILRSTNKRINKIKKSTPNKMSSMKHKMEELKKKYDNFGL